MVFDNNGTVYKNLSIVSFNESNNVENFIQSGLNKFLKGIKDLIWKCISFIENNILTKNKFFYKNKDAIITQLSGKTFEGYLFRIFQDGYGAISKLEASVKTRTSDIILNKSYNDPNIMNYIRGLLIGDNLTVNPLDIKCDKDSFPMRAKEYIYGSLTKETHLVNNIYGGIGGMIDRMMDKNTNINKLKDLYKCFENYTRSMIDTRTKYCSSVSLDAWVRVSEDHMNTCYTYMNIIIQAIRDEYAQSYKLCTSALH